MHRQRNFLIQKQVSTTKGLDLRMSGPLLEEVAAWGTPGGLCLGLVIERGGNHFVLDSCTNVLLGVHLIGQTY